MSNYPLAKNNNPTFYYCIKEFVHQTIPDNKQIDRKIEEALDAVKSHLLIAVNTEMDYLRQRVIFLEKRINELETENSRLKINYLLNKVSP